MAKTTSINLRISPEFRSEIETLARYHGLSMSSYAHSLLVKSVRQAKEQTPEAFPVQYLAPVVATITPSAEAKQRREAQRMIDEAATALKTGMPLSPTGSAITADKKTTKRIRRTG